MAVSQRQPQLPNILSSQLQFTPYTTYYNSFFLLRTPVTVSGQLTEIGYSQSGELTLNSRYPNLSVTLRSISSHLETVLKKYGVSHVSNIWCEDVPLFQVNFSSENKLRKFLESQLRIQSDLASLFATKLAEHCLTYTPPHDISTTVQTQLFLITPDAVKKNAQIVVVTLENHSTCTTLWKESELFDFGALFRVYHLDRSKLPQQGEGALKDLVNELDEVTNWFHMGIHMDVPYPKLFAIRHNCRDIVEDCKIEMLTWRMKQAPLTWSDVVRALVGIKMGSLAQKIALKYGVKVPPMSERSLQQHTAALVEKVSSMDHQLVSRIQQMTREVGVHDDELSRVDNLLDQSRKEEAFAHQKYVCGKDSFTTVHNTMKRFMHERRVARQQLKLKEKELQYLQFLQKQQEENEDLRVIIEAKEAEIELLRESLDELRKKLESSQEASTLRKQLHQSTIELTGKSVHVRELERTRTDLTIILESERRRVDQLLMQLAATSAGNTTKELKCQLAFAKEQYKSQFRDMEMKSHQQKVIQKDREVRRLSEGVQTLEAQLQEVLQTHTREDEVEEKFHRQTVETSDLRVQLAEAEGEKLEAVRRLEGVWREKRELEQWITDLEKKMMAPADLQRCVAVGSGVEVAESAHVNLHKTAQAVHLAGVDGGPLSACVSHSQRQLRKPVKVIGGLNQPWRMVTTRNGDMIVCEMNKVSVFTRDGQKIKTIESVQSGIRSYGLDPTGVAIDSSGNIYYITDYNSDRLFKFSYNGNLVKSVGGKGENPGQFNYPDGIVVSENDMVFVCDKYNHRIQILDTDLNFISCFGTYGGGEGEFKYPTDIAIDSAGNLYVTDQVNHHIQLFSQRGTFLGRFGKRDTAPGELEQPQGIHVDHDWIYVADWNNYHVSVFTISGEFIATLQPWERRRRIHQSTRDYH